MKKMTDFGRDKSARGHSTAQSRAKAFFGSLKSGSRQRGPAVKEFCASYAVTQATFTRLTGFSPRAVAHWAGGREPSVSTGRRLTELNRLFAALGEMVPREKIGPWL